MENASGKNEVQSSSKSSVDVDQKTPCQIKQQGLMTKLGKGDLLRLLSILEGELEARDMCITNLQARINRDAHAKERYFQHSISDPFLALMRDNEAVCGSVTPSTVSSANKTFNKDVMPIYIEPLPLLEKVVGECKRQQVKVKQHLALSDAYYKLVNRELLDVKRKHARDTATGDDVTVALEKEREKLQIEIRVERARSRKIEFEYKNLLQTINKERQRFQIISTMLLEERKVRKSNFGINDDTPIEQLKLQFKEVSIRNRELETLVGNMKMSEASMKQEIQTLQQQLKSTNQSFQAAVKSALSRKGVEAKVTGCGDASAPPISTDYADHNHKVVSVKRTSSVIEKRCLKPGERQPAANNARTQSLSKSFDSTELSDRYYLQLEEKKNPGSGEVSLQITANIVSSPTSGAENFALNSPNQPPPHSAFSSPLTLTKGQKPTSISSGSFQATRQKFQRYTKTKPSPPLTSQRHHTNEATPAAQSRPSKGNAEASSSNAFPSVQAGGKTEGKVNVAKKLPDSGNGYKPQPPKPAKNVASKPTKEEKNDSPRQACPPPVPPKKPSIIQKSNSVKAATARATRDHEVPKKPGSTGGDKTSRISSKPLPVATNKLTNHLTTPKTNLKRPTSLGMNNNSNNNNNKNPTRFGNAADHTGATNLITRPVPPSPAPARLSLSAQQRLFPPQDGGNGKLLSPVTNTVPKSPLGSTIFKF